MTRKHGRKSWRRLMKTVQPSYLHLSNILSSWVEFSSQIVESSFSTRFEFSSSTFQLDVTWIQKSFNLTWHFSSWILDSNSSIQLDAISLDVSERNIITARFFKKLNDKMLDSFQITDSVDSFYKLKLSETMHIHDVFHSELLCSVVDNFLSDQKNESLKSIVINDKDEWKIDDILNSWCYRRWLQYKVKWNDYDNNLNWYNADDDEFMNTQEMIDEFYIKYSRKAR